MIIAPRCTICRHDERARIELMLAARVSLNNVADKFGVKRMALHRHWKNHVGQDRKDRMLIGPVQMKDLFETVAEEGSSRLDYLKLLRRYAMDAIMREHAAGNSVALASVMRVTREILVDIGHLHGDVMRFAPHVNFTVNNFLSDPRFALMQSGLMAIGRDHPAALPAIIALMERLDASAPDGPQTPAPRQIEACAA